MWSGGYRTIVRTIVPALPGHVICLVRHDADDKPFLAEVDIVAWDVHVYDDGPGDPQIYRDAVPITADPMLFSDIEKATFLIRGPHGFNGPADGPMFTPAEQEEALQYLIEEEQKANDAINRVVGRKEPA